ncbi:zinc finger CCCH-type with G patch domain-containing protein [Zeugodacus cucurbitae]|uniref:zinc finger CCCH-type with G patch domain-containing protein n=1 Tax=Zeugodacus cucurbitae TaxID=28588 RepID=UPI000596A588|nr:zinc finger CCCH-type with G patch domain-containing protein [Zeugodacus cucurbitae]
METNTSDYESQLQIVEESLATTENEEERIALNSLKADLLELIELTNQTNAAELSNSADGCNFNEELERFRSEMALLENVESNVHEVTEENIDEHLNKLRVKLEDMVGKKCTAPHQHTWGSVSYHNAIVCGIEDTANMDSNGQLKARLRVLFTNPTHREMLPCSFYLEGECRFDDTQCHFSHGELIDAEKLGEYAEPDFTRLARNCVVLAKLPDRLWYRGRVLCANFVEQLCRVRLDKKGDKRERDFPFEDLLPIFHDDDLSSGSSSNESCDELEESEDSDEIKSARQAKLVEKSLFEFKPTQPLGEWEKYTRGIGSKIMAKMGYVHGTGLGSDGSGIVIPVTAQILPQGYSLDRCMELREAANGDKDYFSIEKKLQQQKKKQENINAKAYERELQRTDVFSFINDNILSGGSEIKKAKKNISLSNETTKSLNVASVRLADDIRRKEREIAKIRQSMARNSVGSDVYKRTQQQLQIKTQELKDLQREETVLSKEQASRKTKDKLSVF